MPKNRKIILGLLDSDPYPYKNDFLSILKSNGFNIYSISDKIKEISKYLLRIEDAASMPSDFIDKLRKRGYLVNKLYWINLLLTSIHEKDRNIVIKDILEEDIYEGHIVPIVSDFILIPNTKCVKYPQAVSNEAVKTWIKEIEHKLYNMK